MSPQYEPSAKDMRMKYTAAIDYFPDRPLLRRGPGFRSVFEQYRILNYAKRERDTRYHAHSKIGPRLPTLAGRCAG